MGPRKRPRQDDAGANTVAASSSTCSAADKHSPSLTPLRPSQATTTSQVSSLSAAPSTPSFTNRPDSGIGMPPISFPRSESRSSKDEREESKPQGNKVVCAAFGLSRTPGCNPRWLAVVVLTCNQIQKTRSWYGSLGRKSTASLSIQKETIAGSPLKAGSTPDFHRYDLKKNGDAASLSGTSQDALTKLDETASDAPNPKTDIDEDDKNADAPVASQTDQADARATMTRDAAVITDTSMPDAPPMQRPTTSSGWLGGWFSRFPATDNEPSEGENTSKMPVKLPSQPESPAQESPAPAQTEQSHPPIEQRPNSYWFNFWSNHNAPGSESQGPSVMSASTPPANKDSVDESLEEAPPADPDPYTKPSAGSTWAFWSRDQPKSPGKQPRTLETGELAVVGERSEHYPKRTNSMDMGISTKQEPPKFQGAETTTSNDKPTKKGKKNKPLSINVEPPSRPQTAQSDTISIAAESPSRSKSKASGTATNPVPQNLLLPSFRRTYRMKENPSILKQITSMLLRTQQPPVKHVFLSRDPPKIRKALAIGVHGLFPATYRTLN